MADISAVPNSTLSVPNTTPPPGHQTSPSRFILFSQDWLNLQNHIQMSLQLPINQDDFKTKYGDFTDQKLITDTFDVMKNVQGLSAEFGSPQTVKQKIITDPGFISGSQAPAEIYPHIVWLATQISNAASTFNYTLSNLRPLLDPSMGSPETRANNLRMILVGEGGLASTANDMLTKTRELQSKLAAFEVKINDAHEKFSFYTGKSSSVLAAANELIGTYRDDIENDLQPAADKAHALWLNFTIAAVSTSVPLMILTAGLSWPVALAAGAGGVVLGILALKELVAYNNLMSKIAKKKKDIQQKTRLVTDLSGFNTSMGLVQPAMAKFKHDLQVIEGVWLGIAGNLAYITQNYTVEQLSSYPWLMQAMKIGDATAKWRSIGDNAAQFTQHSLVSYDTSVQFGQQIPAEAA